MTYEPGVPIRRAATADLDAVWRVEREVFGPDPYPRFFFRQAHDLWGDLLLVAEDPQGGVAGYIAGAPAIGAAEGWILSVAVRSEHRGLGLGRQLTEALLETFAARQILQVRITVNPDNEAGVRLYQRLGFVTEERDESYFGPGEPRLLMVLRMSAG